MARPPTEIGDPILTLDGAILFDTSEGPAVKYDCDDCETTWLWLLTESPWECCPECLGPLHARGTR